MHPQSLVKLYAQDGGERLEAAVKKNTLPSFLLEKFNAGEIDMRFQMLFQR